MTSPGIKRLRILTGKHAGACLDLEPGEHCIGPDHDFDITITDWTAPPVQLHVAADAGVPASWRERGRHGAGATTGDAADEPARPMPDFEPRAHGDIVLCVGPVGAEWPADVELLVRALRPAPLREPAPVQGHAALRRASAFVVTAGVVLSAAWATMSIMQASSQAAGVAPDSPVRVAQELRQAVARIGGGSLRVEENQGALVVTGLLETREKAREMRDAIRALPATVRVLPRFGVVPELAEAIRSGAGLSDAEVRHLGAGVFLFSADTPDPEATRAALARLARDLAPAVQRIDAALETTAAPTATAPNTAAALPPGPMLSVYSDGDVSFVQTRDGAKHLVITPSLSDAATP